MALALSFNDADAARIKNYAAMKKMGVFDNVPNEWYELREKIYRFIGEQG